MASVPLKHSSQPVLFNRLMRGRLVRLHSTPAKARNQMNTDMSTCTTSAV